MTDLQGLSYPPALSGDRECGLGRAGKGREQAGLRLKAEYQGGEGAVGRVAWRRIRMDCRVKVALAGIIGNSVSLGPGTGEVGWGGEKGADQVGYLDSGISAGPGHLV